MHEWLPIALSQGVSEDVFWNSTYAKLTVYAKAHSLKIEEQDYMNWCLGIYFAHSINATIGNMFTKENAEKEDYLPEPLLQSANKESEKLIKDPEANERLAVEEMKARIRMMQQQQ